MVENNENTPVTGDAEQAGGRRRTRIFGARKAARKGPAVGVETESAAPATPVAEKSATEKSATERSVEKPVEKPATEKPAAKKPAAEKPVAADTAVDASVVDVETLAAEQGADELPLPEPIVAEAGANVEADAVDPATPVIPAVLSTTSLIFYAPDVLPMPARPDAQDEGEESTVRRRSRRRSGEEGRGTTADDPANTVVRVRQPRQPELITEPQRVKGSTRLEAKKQRRRDGRDAGRRRAVITEAEFLARRESVDRQMVVRSKSGRIQIGVLEDGVLVEHYVARNQDASLIGNVYLGRVQNVLPSMEAAFVDIGRGRNAVLYSGEVDWEAAAAEHPGANQPRRIELALKPGDKVLVQVTKDPIGHKGARLTSQISLPGRYLVYVPNGSMNGISRKLPDTERARLKKILKEVLPDNQGVIVRTAAEGATEDQLTLDVNRLIEQWAGISKQLESVQAPALLHSEPDLLIKIVRDVFNEDFQKMIIAGEDARETIESYLRAVAPDLLERVEPYEGDRDAFDAFRITEQIEKALDRKVWLPSGGSLVIDRTEAMTVVDVNTGKFVGSGGNLEETVTKNNLEAAEEIVRQLRLRDIGGIIVVDFIDMVLESNRDLVLRRLIECLSRDRTKHQVAEVTSLGLVQMTRKKLGLGLLESFSENCDVCAGRGIIVHHDPVVKHRVQQQTPQPQQQSRRRGGQGGGAQQQPAAEPAKAGNGTHGITEDAKHALAMIAQSTLHPHEKEAAAAQAEAQATDAPTTQPAEKKSRRSRRGRGGSKSDAQQGTPTDAPAAHQSDAPAEAPADKPVEKAPAAAKEAAATGILDIPVAASREPKRRDPEAAQLLDSVLEALPAPKEPGQGRSRSRRVTTAGLSTTPVEPIVTSSTRGDQAAGE